MNRAETRWTGAERGGLFAFFLFTMVALAGFGAFGVRPDRLPDSPAIVSFWAISAQFFAQLHIIVAAVVLGVVLVLRAGRVWLTAALAVFVVSLFAELVGTRYGLPFGGYEYTNLLGPKVAGRVPWIIPLSWFLMALPAYGLATVAFPGTDRARGRISLATLLLVAWDLALDPAMSYSPPLYWQWEATGPYYGMPWMNLFGWLGTGAVIMVAQDRLGVWRWVRRIPASWLLGFYGVTLLMPLGMVVLEGLWLAAASTLAALLLCLGVYHVGTRTPLVAPSPWTDAPLENPKVASSRPDRLPGSVAERQ
jgi:uncharacterized membrane protein